MSVPTCVSSTEDGRSFATLRWVVARVPMIVQKAKPKQKMTSKSVDVCLVPAVQDKSPEWSVCGKLLFFPKGLDEEVTATDDIQPSLGLDLHIAMEREKDEESGGEDGLNVSGVGNDAPSSSLNTDTWHVRVVTSSAAIDVDEDGNELPERNLGYTLDNVHKTTVNLGDSTLLPLAEALEKTTTIPVSGFVPFPIFAEIKSKLVVTVEIEVLPKGLSLNTDQDTGGGISFADVAGQLSTLQQTVATIVTRTREEDGYEGLPTEDPKEVSPEWLKLFGGLMMLETPAAWKQVRNGGWPVAVDALAQVHGVFIVGDDDDVAASVRRDEIFGAVGVRVLSSGELLSGPGGKATLSDPPQSLIRAALDAYPSLVKTRHEIITFAASEKDFWWNFFWCLEQIKQTCSEQALRAIVGSTGAPTPGSATHEALEKCAASTGVDVADQLEAFIHTVQFFSRPKEAELRPSTTDIRGMIRSLQEVSSSLDTADDGMKAGSHHASSATIAKLLELWSAEESFQESEEVAMLARIAALRGTSASDIPVVAAENGATPSTSPLPNIKLDFASPLTMTSTTKNDCPRSLAGDIVGEFQKLSALLVNLEETRKGLPTQ